MLAAVRFIEQRFGFKAQNFVHKPDWNEKPTAQRGLVMESGSVVAKSSETPFPNHQSKSAVGLLNNMVIFYNKLPLACSVICNQNQIHSVRLAAPTAQQPAAPTNAASSFSLDI